MEPFTFLLHQFFYSDGEHEHLLILLYSLLVDTLKVLKNLTITIITNLSTYECTFMREERHIFPTFVYL